MTCVSIYIYMYIRFMYIYIWYVYLCIQHVYLYITLQKKIVGTLQHGHCGEDIIKVPLWKHFSASFFGLLLCIEYTMMLFERSVYGHNTFGWMVGINQLRQSAVGSRSSWGFFDVLSLMNPFQTRTLAFISGFAPGRWRVNGQHVWAALGSPVFFFKP